MIVGVGLDEAVQKKATQDRAMQGKTGTGQGKVRQGQDKFIYYREINRR